MSKTRFDEDFNLDFEHEARCMLDACDDPDCVYCQKDDADAAFWDEFMSDPSETSEPEMEYEFHIHDENTHEELKLEGLNLRPYTIIRVN